MAEQVSGVPGQDLLTIPWVYPAAVGWGWEIPECTHLLVQQCLHHVVGNLGIQSPGAELACPPTRSPALSFGKPHRPHPDSVRKSPVGSRWPAQAPSSLPTGVRWKRETPRLICTLGVREVEWTSFALSIKLLDQGYLTVLPNSLCGHHCPWSQQGHKGGGGGTYPLPPSELESEKEPGAS